MSRHQNNTPPPPLPKHFCRGLTIINQQRLVNDLTFVRTTFECLFRTRCPSRKNYGRSHARYIEILWIPFSRTHLTVGYSFKPRAGISHLLGEMSFLSCCFCLGLCGFKAIFCKKFYSSRAASARCCMLIY